MLLTQSEVDYFADEEARAPNSANELGSVLQRDRIAQLAERAILNRPGDVIEIGVLSGGTSMRLAPLAAKYSRRFIAIDNWPTDIINHHEYRLDLCEQQFYQNVAPWKHCVDVWRADIHSPETLKRITEHVYAFAFSDDGHSYDDHLSELRALLPNTFGLVCVDDVYLPEVRQAVADALKEFPEWHALYGRGLREAWLVKP